MRILTLLDAFKLGGAETLIANLARVAGTAGIELDVVSLHPPSPDRSALEPMLRDAGLEPRYLGVQRTLDPAGLRALVREIKTSRCDVVHAHLEMAITLGVPAARMAGVPAVCTFHHVHRPISGRTAARERLAVEAATRSSRVVFVSEASRRSFADAHRAGRPVPANWTVLHNGIDTSDFTPPAPGVPARLPAGMVPEGHGPVVMVLAALRDFKGIRHAVDAWPAVLREHPTAHLLLVGSGSEEDALRRQVAELGLQERVTFAGMRLDVPDLVRAVDMTVLPSVFGENLPTVLMEAGACGKPVVASRIGGIPDIVEDGVTGLLVPPSDPGAIAAAVVRLLDDPQERERMGAAGRARVLEHFSAQVWAQRLAALYREVQVRQGAVA